MRRRGRRAPGPPRWIAARYAGRCIECEAEVRHGDQALYYPRGSKLLCESCGRAAWALIEAERLHSERWGHL